MYAESGGCGPSKVVAVAHTNGWPDGVGCALALGAGDCEADDVGLDPATGEWLFVGRFRGFATNRTPITKAARAAAATPAIHSGGLFSGAWATDERIRSR